MTTDEIRQKYLSFFKKGPRNHQEISPAPLVLENDPTTLFTSSGMQPLVPYLLGETHPEGKRLVNSQPAIRTQDIEEVGDNRHTTYFEMLGNWSLGDYFKREQLPWVWEFLTKELKLQKEKLYVSIFEGNRLVPRDEESYKIWKSLGVAENHIFEYGVEKNWWSRSGTPDKMPIGEIGGPDSEVFFEFEEILHNPKFGKTCHPNCDCGRFLEIGNSVFIEYRKTVDGLEELPQKNVDFGGGLERMVMATENEADIFKTSIFSNLVTKLEKITGKKYGSDPKVDRRIRIIAEHTRAASALIKSGIEPSNKQQGYILRRLIRRTAINMRGLKINLEKGGFDLLAEDRVNQAIEKEIGKFGKTLDRGLKEIEKIEKVDAKKAFDLYQTYGFPLEITEEIFAEKGQKIDKGKFRLEFEKHQEKSRSASTGVFKGGLADHSEETTKFHTATHLIHAALRKILGEHVGQKGSNITAERLRFDFSHPQKLTEKQIKEVEDLVNQKIKAALPVVSKLTTIEKAKKEGALAFFGERYDEKVKVYSIGDFSKEVCGGPHVENTSQIGRVKIIKEESAGSGIRRLYATRE